MATPLTQDGALTAESESIRSGRMAWETAALEIVRADPRAGRALAGEALAAWLARWADDEPVDIETGPAA